MTRQRAAANSSRRDDAVEILAADIPSLSEALLKPVNLKSESSGLPKLAYSREEAAQVSGMELKTIKHLIKSGKLPFVKTGDQRGRVILHEDLMNFLQRRRKALERSPK